MNTHRICAALLTTAVVIACSSVWSDETEEEAVTPLQRQKLPDVRGKQVVLAVEGYEPGQASTPHRHAGSVFAYVLGGEVISQLEGQQPITCKAGQSCYEPPRVPHLVSRNASTIKPARLHAWLFTDEGGQVKEPSSK